MKCRSGLIVIILALLWASVSLGGEFIQFDQKNLTPSALPLELSPPEMQWDGSGLNLQATVRNSGMIDYDFVQVLFAFYDAEGKLIVEQSVISNPQLLKGKDIGQLDKYFQCEGVKPVSMTYQVTGIP